MKDAIEISSFPIAPSALPSFIKRACQQPTGGQLCYLATQPVGAVNTLPRVDVRTPTRVHPIAGSSIDSSRYSTQCRHHPKPARPAEYARYVAQGALAAKDVKDAGASSSSVNLRFIMPVQNRPQ